MNAEGSASLKYLLRVIMYGHNVTSRCTCILLVLIIHSAICATLPLVLFKCMSCRWKCFLSCGTFLYFSILSSNQNERTPARPARLVFWNQWLANLTHKYNRVKLKCLLYWRCFDEEQSAKRFCTPQGHQSSSRNLTFPSSEPLAHSFASANPLPQFIPCPRLNTCNMWRTPRTLVFPAEMLPLACVRRMHTVRRHKCTIMANSLWIRDRSQVWLTYFCWAASGLKAKACKGPRWN